MTVAGTIRELLFIFVYCSLHTLIHILDLTVIRLVQCLIGASTRYLGFPHDKLVWNSRPHTRESQTNGIIDVVVPSAARTNQLFGWPVVLPRNREDSLPYAPPDLKADRVPFLGPRYTNHISTIVAFFKAAAPIRYRREIVETCDGCELAVDWAYPEDNTHLHSGIIASTLDAVAGVARVFGYLDETFTRFGIPPQSGLGQKTVAAANHIGVFSIVPGLLSTSNTVYIRSFVRAALAHGFVVAIVHTRGFIVPLKKPKMWHGGSTWDLRHWTYNYLSREALEKRFGRPTNAALVGFSLGGSVLCNFLAEEGDKVAKDSAVVCAAAVSTPWRFHDVMEPMNRRFQKLTYDVDFRTGLIEYLKENEKVLRDPATGKAAGFDWDRALKVKDVPEFDQHVVIKHHGWKTTDEYYHAVSSFGKLHKIKLPTVCVAVADDPICPSPPVDEWREIISRNPNLSYAEIPAGGHLGSLGHPLAECTRQPTSLESITCRSMAHFLVHHAHKQQQGSSTAAEKAEGAPAEPISS